jgi:predicted hydrocarbon binding protein
MPGEAAVVKVKGTKITSKFAYLERRHGPGAKAAVLAWLSEDDQRVLRMVLDVGWYPQDLYVRLLQAICETVGGGDASVYAAIGEHTADHQFSHIYRAYRASALTETLENMVPVHAKLNDPSGMEVSFDLPGHATIVVTAPHSNPVICAVSLGFYRRSIELHGERDVDVRETKCSGRGDHACQFEIHWRPKA